jgi:hypothetical protein
MKYAYMIRSSATPEDPELVKELSEVCESVLSRLSDAITLVPVMGDAEESIEEGVRDQVSDWARDGWLGLVKLEMPDGTNLMITREEVIETPDAYVIPEGSPMPPRPSESTIHRDPRGEFSRRTGMGYPDNPPPHETEDELIDAVTVQAFRDIQWVIDDLRSWESNVESATYNADKLADALTVIKARLRHDKYTKGGS